MLAKQQNNCIEEIVNSGTTDNEMDEWHGYPHILSESDKHLLDTSLNTYDPNMSILEGKGNVLHLPISHSHKFLDSQQYSFNKEQTSENTKNDQEDAPFKTFGFAGVSMDVENTSTFFGKQPRDCFDMI